MSESVEASLSGVIPGKSTEARSISSGFLLRHFNMIAAVDIALELEAVLECCSLIEYEVVSCAVRILEEVTYALELNSDTRVVLEEGWLCVSLSDHERLWVEIVLVVLSLWDLSHLSLSEELVVKSELDFLSMLCRYPVDGTLY
jgi:hypothetical protein